MRRLLLCSTFMKPCAAFANTNSAATLYVSTTVQDSDLTQSQYEALTYVQVKGVGSVGEIGTSTNILTYDTWDTDVAQKAKGMSDAGSPDVEVARIPTDPGQILLRSYALVNSNYAFKIVRNDKVVPSGTPTIIYNRGLVTGPKRPQGRNEDFDLEVFTLALVQKEIVVNPSSAGNPPVNTVAPAITGTAQVNSVLTCSNGTFTGDATITYTRQWFAGGSPISGATNATYIPVTGNVGKIITCVVTASNAAGVAYGYTAPTSAVIA